MSTTTLRHRLISVTTSVAWMFSTTTSISIIFSLLFELCKPYLSSFNHYIQSQHHYYGINTGTTTTNTNNTGTYDYGILLFLIISILLPHLVLAPMISLLQNIVNSSTSSSTSKVKFLSWTWYDEKANTHSEKIPTTTMILSTILFNFILHISCLIACGFHNTSTSTTTIENKSSPIIMSSFLPNIPRRATEVFLFVLMFDSTFYFAHRLLHRYAMDYHQLHHSIKGDKAWNAYYMHPIDSFLENTFPGFIGPLLLRFFIARSRRNIIVSTTATAMMMIPVGAVTVDPISIAAWFFYQELDNVRVHSGGDLRFLESGYHHYVHHQLYRCNYSNEWIDRLFGTYVESHNDAGVMEKKK